MRSTVDGYVYYRFVQQYDFQNILEIGFFEGQTCGLLAESASATARVTAIDPVLNRSVFDSVYHEYTNKVKLVQAASQQFEFDQEYDLINVDGDKSYPAVREDLSNAAQALAHDGVLIVNEYYLETVAQAVSEVMPQSGLVPFLRTNQSTFFSSPHVDRAEFLDYTLPAQANNFIRFQNIELDKHVILYVDSLPVFTEQLDFFRQAIKLYNL
jgi:SAM-dependent methyltransferase